MQEDSAGNAPLRIGVLQRAGKQPRLSNLLQTINGFEVTAYSSLRALRIASVRTPLHVVVADPDLPNEGWTVSVAESLNEFIAPVIPVILVSVTPNDAEVVRRRATHLAHILLAGSLDVASLDSIVRGTIAACGKRLPTTDGSRSACRPNLL